MTDKKKPQTRAKPSAHAGGLLDSGGGDDAGVPAQIELRGIETLVPYARNSRTHSDAQVAELAASIDEFGLVGGIVVRDGVIAKGHGTLQGCIKLLKAGKSLYPAPGRAAGARPYPDGQIPVIDASGWTDAQFRAFVIADNRLALNADWNYEMLAVELDDLRDMDFDLNLLGFDAQELNDMIGTAGSGPESVEGEDDAPEPPENPVTKAGDVWLLGDHRVMCGDSTDAGSVALLMAGDKADMLLTDPPYNVAYEGKTSEALTIENDKMGDEQFRAFLKSAFAAADASMRPGAVFYIWHADVEGYNFRGACKDIEWPIRQCLIWRKSAITLGRQDYQWIHEPCLYGWKPGAGHTWASDRKQTTVLDFDKPSRNGEHPTMKPVALFEYQLLNNTKDGDAVLDSFGGSGTTLIAAEKSGRRARLMELDPRYCDVIVRRWQDFTGQLATLEGDGRSFEHIADERIGATAE